MPELRPSERRGDPNVATLLSWFLPGAGHMYLGATVPGVVALVLIEGLYALGWLLSEGRTFEFLDPELRGPLATVLTPEIGNLGGMIAQLRTVGYGLADPVPYASTVELGGMLTALSGVFNLFVMSHAHLLARTPRSSDGAKRASVHPALAAALTFLVPGLGHFVQGRKRRGVIVFLLLVGFFALGTLLAEGSNLSRERHFYYWSGQFLIGLPAILAEFVSGRPPVTGHMPYADIGLLYACMPGLLNILAMLDVYGWGERDWLGVAQPEERDAGAAAEEGVA